MRAMEWNEARVDALRKLTHQHKYDHGHLLVVSGTRYQTGAARLAARAALRVGAGLVTMGASEEALKDLSAHLTEIMLTEITQPAALSALLEAEPRLNALCIGPALGLGQSGAGLVFAALQSRRSCVLDADALTLIAQVPGLAEHLHSGCVLTPHAGEFRRLCPDQSLGKTLADRALATQTAAQRFGCTILLKGAQTVVARPNAEASVLDSSESKTAPWLATAGAGDVLSGLIAGLLARGLAPEEAAETGSALHVAAADIVGPGLIAGDLPEALPKVLRQLGV